MKPIGVPPVVVRRRRITTGFSTGGCYLGFCVKINEYNEYAEAEVFNVRH